MRKLTAIIVGLALPVIADESSRQTVNKTERINFSTPGTIRIEHSFGEIDIEGWDQPEIEITTTAWIEDVHAKESASAVRRLESVLVTTKRDGSDVVISTVYPMRKSFTHRLSWWSDVELTCRIKAPRGSRLVVDQNNRGINIFGMTGDIRATVTKGQITVTLADGPHTIDAKCDFGNVYSDFEGTSRRRWLGKTFERESAQPARNIYLRVRSGDIVIFKMPAPPLV